LQQKLKICEIKKVDTVKLVRLGTPNLRPLMTGGRFSEYFVLKIEKGSKKVDVNGRGSFVRAIPKI
jgi:hypothetical protein